uniref:Uncharacterized protein n=1 Tax=Bionectria ochroleuca TaxID=29856 RepID=A0A8H7KDT8_BIOOC
MEAPFEDREKRFVLAEMIKNSSIDADVLAAFVRSSQIEPNWMYMQLPSGRTMHQCMEAASQMSIAAPSLKRKPWEDISFEHQAKRPATSERHEPVHHVVEHAAPPPASLSPHIAILPRPTSANLVHQQQTLSQEGPKKEAGPPGQIKPRETCALFSHSHLLSCHLRQTVPSLAALYHDQRFLPCFQHLLPSLDQ